MSAKFPRGRGSKPILSHPSISFDKKISEESVQTKNYKLLHAYVQCVYIVSAKHQIAPSKAVVGVDRPIKALSMHIQKPYKVIIV